MIFGVRMLLVMGSICIVFGVRGTSNVEARGGPKIDKIENLQKYSQYYTKHYALYPKCARWPKIEFLGFGERQILGRGGSKSLM